MRHNDLTSTRNNTRRDALPRYLSSNDLHADVASGSEVKAGNVLKTLEYYRGSDRPGSNVVIRVKLRKRKSARFQLFSSFIFLCDL